MSAELVLTNDLSTEVSNRGTAINNEASIRLAADQSLATAVSVEQGRIDAILDGSDVDLDQFAEIVSFVNGIDLENDNALLSAVTSIGTAINDEADARTSSDTSLETNINAEAEARADVDASLESDLSTETKDRQDADTSLSTELSTQISRRVVADISIQSDLSTEVSTRTSADNSLEVALSAEIVRAGNAEDSIATELSTQVSYLISNIDVTEIDSFTEIVANLSTEVVRAESAELSLADDFANIYFRNAGVVETANGIVTEFTFNNELRTGSQAVYLNGLLQDAGDYTITTTSVTFISAPKAGDKVAVYGMY
jgi:hypothetical protein